MNEDIHIRIQEIEQKYANLTSYPHHKHISSTGEIIPSTEKTLDDVVALIEHTIKSK